MNWCNVSIVNLVTLIIKYAMVIMPFWLFDVQHDRVLVPRVVKGFEAHICQTRWVSGISFMFITRHFQPLKKFLF